MVWVKLDDQFPIHRKIAALTDTAFRLHAAALAWCARNLTDGFVPDDELAQVCAQVRAPEKFATELADRRVWHRADHDCPSEHCLAPHTHADDGRPVTGWVVHDYLEYQQPRSKVLRIRKARSIAGAEGGKRSGETRRRRPQPQGTKTEANPKQIASRVLEPRPGPLRGPGEGAPPAAPYAAAAAYGDRGPADAGPAAPDATSAAPSPDNPAPPQHPAAQENPRDPRHAAARAALAAARETWQHDPRATQPKNQAPRR
jgi:hypothetical protein